MIAITKIESADASERRSGRWCTRRYARRNKVHRGDKNMILRWDDSIESIEALSRSNWLASRVDETRRDGWLVFTFIDVFARNRQRDTRGKDLRTHLPTYLPTVIFRIVRRVWSMHNASRVLCEGVDSPGPYHYRCTYACKRMGDASLPSSTTSSSFNFGRWPKYGICGEFRMF